MSHPNCRLSFLNPFCPGCLTKFTFSKLNIFIIKSAKCTVILLFLLSYFFSPNQFCYIFINDIVNFHYQSSKDFKTVYHAFFLCHQIISHALFFILHFQFLANHNDSTTLTLFVSFRAFSSCLMLLCPLAHVHMEGLRRNEGRMMLGFLARSVAFTFPFPLVIEHILATLTPPSEVSSSSCLRPVLCTFLAR